MKKILKKGLIFGAIYLVLLMCAFTMSSRIERLDNSNGEGKAALSVFTLEVRSNS